MTIEENKNIEARKNHPFIFKVNGERFFPDFSTQLSYESMGVDTAKFTRLPPGLIKPGDSVEVFYNNSRVFAGTAEKIINLQSSGKDRTETVICYGPWGKLNRYVFRQEWCGGKKNGVIVKFSSSRVILNQFSNGERMTMQDQLKEIATYAQDVCGFRTGEISSPDIYLPLDETRDITCASAIQRELRFFPRKVVFFDYSSSPLPTLNIIDPDTSNDSIYIADIPKYQRSYEYTAHPITAVDISTESVEIDTSADEINTVLRGLNHQIYPENADTDDIDCLKVFIPLQKGAASTSLESFKSITEDIPENLNDVEWWRNKHPRLANIAPSTIEIKDAVRNDKRNFPRIAAATSAQITAAGCSCEISRFTCTCKITTEEDVEENIILTMDFLTTDAKTKTYTWQTGSSFTAAEKLPEGLAKALFEQRSNNLLNENISIRLGEEFPRLGDTADGLILQSFDVDCGNLSASLHFGHPEHLSVEDMRDLLNGFRQRASVYNAVLRSAESPEEEAEEQGAIQPINSTEFSPGQKLKTIIGGANNGKIKLDPSGLESNEEIAVRKITTKEGKAIKLLASDDIDNLGGVGVSSLNLMNGDIRIIGGNDISVETHDKTIVIAYRNGKPPDNDSSSEDSHNPCSHDPSGNQGGVSPSDENKSSSNSSNTSIGGIPAIDPFIPHIGDNNCNTNC